MARRRVRGRGSVERLASGAYRARIRGKSLDGRPFELHRTCATLEDAERALVSLRARALDIEAGLVVLEETLTLAEWKPKAIAKRLTWTRKDQSMWKRVLRPLHARPMVSIDEGAVRMWASGLAADYAPATIRSAWHLLRRLIGFAVAHHVLARLPFGDAPLRLVSDGECGTRRALEPLEWERVLDAARRIDAAKRSGPLADLWLRLAFMYQTGGRPVELAQLGPGDVVAGEHGPCVHISAAVIAKGGKPGMRPLGRELAALLVAHVDAMDEKPRRLGVFFPRKGQRGRWLPRWEVDGKGYKTGRSWLSRYEVRLLRSESGVDDFDPYMVRHTRLTDVAHAPGSSQQTVSLVGGHKHYKTSARYVHSDARHLTAELFDASSSLGLGDGSSEPPDDEPSGGGKGKGKGKGKLRVLEGGAAAPAAGGSGGASLRAHDDASSAHDDASSAHRGPSDHGRPVGGGGLEGDDGSDELEAARAYAEAVRAHGVAVVAGHVLRTLGPASSLWEAGALDLVRARLRPDDLDGVLLASLSSELRAHAARETSRARPKSTPENDRLCNDSRRGT